MHSSEIKDLVRDVYRHVPASTAAVAHELYTAEELAQVPRGGDQSCPRGSQPPALRRYPARRHDSRPWLWRRNRHHPRRPAHRPHRKVIGLNFLPEMLQRTASAAQEAAWTTYRPCTGRWRPFRSRQQRGFDHLQRRDQPVGRKARVMAECARVLRAGGELCVSDLTVDQDQLPADILTQPAAWLAVSAAPWPNMTSSTN